MKNSYSSLKFLSSMIIMLGYLNLMIGLGISAMVFADTSLDNGHKVVYAIGVILLTLLSSLFLWAIGQFIKLCVNVADDINTINENTFYIANNIPKGEKTK